MSSLSLTMESLIEAAKSYSELQPQFLSIILVSLAALFVGYFAYKTFSKQARNLPPGSLGFPLIGESFSFVKAQKKDKTTEWIESRIAKYGPVFKTSLMGSPVVVLIGQAGNRFIFSSNDAISSNQPKSTAKILGKFSIFELQGNRHKLMRGAMMSFLQPDSIQRFVGKMDSLVQQHLLQEIKGKDTIQFVSLIKKVTFKVTSSLLFGLPEGMNTDELLEDFTMALRGTWALPLDFPGTIYRKACKAHDRLYEALAKLVKKRKSEMEEEMISQQEDIVSTLLKLRDEDGKPLLDEEIIDNMASLIIASHDTSAIVSSLLVRHLARDTHVSDLVLQEQMEVVNRRGENEKKLQWDDLQKMKYTWRVIQELMRLTPPVVGNFKRAIRDTSFGGYEIPKGWQVFWVASGTHMDRKIFQEPDKFDPSRFESASKSVPPYTYIPFGAGVRACPGVEFARIEMLLIVHYLIINYRWTEMIPDEPITCDPMPYPAMGLPILLHPRNDAHTLA